MSWFYTCFCGAEQGEGGGTCSSGAGGRQGAEALQGRSWQLGVGLVEHRVQVSRAWQFGVRGPAARGQQPCPASPPSALLAGGITGVPAHPCRERAFWSRVSSVKRRVGGTCHAGGEGVIVVMMVMMMMGGSRAWCRAGGHLTPPFNTCLWREYWTLELSRQTLGSPGSAWAHLNSSTWVFMETTRTGTYIYV